MNADVQRLIDLAQSDRIITADEAQKLAGFLERKQGDLDAAASYLVRFHNVDPQLADGLKARAAADAASGAAPPPPRRASRPFVEVQAPPPLVPLPAQPAQSGLGFKVAGGVLIANALLSFAALAVMNQAPGLRAGLSGSPISGIIDLIIGASLLTGNTKYRTWALVRVALGTLLFCGMAAVQGDVATLVVQSVFSGSLLALLLAEASTARVIAGGVGAGLCLLLALLGVFAIASGKPLFRVGPVVKGKLEEISGGKVMGDGFSYKLLSPGRGWRVRNTQDARHDNATIDRWLVQEKLDAHICVSALHLDVPQGRRLEPEKLLSGMSGEVGRKFTTFKILDEAAIDGVWDGAKFVHAVGTSEVGEIELLYGLYVKDATIYEVQAFAPRHAYKEVAADSKRVITNFAVE
ncbi:MAG TPA: hypothetical protein VFF73_38190 [Planctomycetota bacterium]|nr:hypothetical protein [Planctomycetota bacterium]